MQLKEETSENPHTGNKVSDTYTFDLFDGRKDEEPIEPTEVSVNNNFEEDSFDFEIKEVDSTLPNTESYGFYTTPKETSTEDLTLNKEEEHDDRVRRLKDVSYKWDNMNKIKEFEETPAYTRRGVSLDETPHSSENNVSRFSVDSFDVEGEKRPEIRKNNGFLNDNVD